jgi:hypothetical protein
MSLLEQLNFNSDVERWTLTLACANAHRQRDRNFRLLTSNNPRTSQRKRHRLPISNAIEAASSSGPIVSSEWNRAASGRNLPL